MVYFLSSSRFLVAVPSCIVFSSTRLKAAPEHVVDQGLVTTLCCNSGCFACLLATWDRVPASAFALRVWQAWSGHRLPVVCGQGLGLGPCALRTVRLACPTLSCSARFWIVGAGAPVATSSCRDSTPSSSCESPLSCFGLRHSVRISAPGLGCRRGRQVGEFGL